MLQTLILQLIVINKLLKIDCREKLITSINSTGKMTQETYNAFLIVIVILIVINKLVAKLIFATIIYIIVPEHEKILLM